MKAGHPPTAVSDPSLKVGIDGVPSFARARNEKVMVLVTRTNPVLYSATALPGEQRDIPELKDLQAFVQLAGGTLLQALQVSESSVHALKLAAVAKVGPGALTALPAPSVDIVGLDVYVQQRVAQVKAGLAPLKTAIQVVNAKTAALERERLNAVWYVQALETGPALESGEYLKDRSIGPLVTAVPAAFRTLRDELGSLGSVPCAEPYGSLREATRLLLDPIPATRLSESTQAFQEAIGTLRTVTEAAESCPPLGPPAPGHPSEVRILRDAAAFLANFTPAQQPTGGARNLALALHEAGAAIDSAASTVATVKKDGQRLLDGNGAAAKVAGTLELLLERETSRHVPEMLAACSNGGVIELPEWPDPYDWDKLNVHKLSVTADAPGMSEVVKSRQEIKESAYVFAPAHKVKLILGFAGFWTNVKDESYAPVTVEGKGDQKYVGRTKEDSMAGRPALFLTLTQSENEVGGIDLGATISADNPGFFVGLSVKLFHVARLGGGISFHRVTRLADDQTFVKKTGSGALDETSLTPIGSADDVRTRETFQPGAYVNLTFTVPQLPFFKPKD